MLRHSSYVLLFTVLAGGCGHPEPKNASEGVFLGALDGARASLGCGIGFIVCAPFTIAGGAVAGGIVGGMESRSVSITAGERAALREAASRPPVPLGEHFDWIGRVDDDDDLPQGTMYLATRTVRELSGGRLAPNVLLATVVVEYDVNTRYGEKSYLGLTSTDCVSKTIWIHSWETFSGRNGGGIPVRSWTLPPMRASNPPGTLGAAVNAVCAKVGTPTTRPSEFPQTAAVTPVTPRPVRDVGYRALAPFVSRNEMEHFADLKRAAACANEWAYVGMRARHENGKWAEVKTVSGKSNDCANPTRPTAVELTYVEEP